MDTHKPTILVVDDVLDNIEVLNEILNPHYEVMMALNGLKALKIAESASPPDLILLDIMMPGMNGFEVCRKLKESALTRKIPVIFVTTLNEVADEALGFSAGGVDYITKPFSPSIVQARIKTHLTLYDQNRMLEERVKERTFELVQTQDVAIFSLSSLAETRDNETGDHIRRTQYYVQALAQHLRALPSFCHQLDDESINLMHKSAPLHDVGKVGIRDEILLKPGRLSPAEFEIMQTHTKIGSNAITRGMKVLGLDRISSFLRYGREIAYTHHEKWDGSGYPEGLRGNDIPLSGRIMAICDVYDALISRRVYKPPFSHEEAVEIIRNGRETHFDPHLTDAFIQLKDKFLAIAHMYTTLAEEKESLEKSMKNIGLK
ncbi:MAG: two-component system response regulator [Candidatus Riflebacteria bacterium]|nr:two-component system response regulator [Candidatus Riflebacteria bacterium]